jgi:predicted phosphate transport protein (TIGR00153 family)
MFGKLMPEDGRFFDMFNQHAELCVKGARELLALTTDFTNVDIHLHAIDVIEKQADAVADKTIAMLHKSFITPLDRDDIHRLITRMDDILDMMEDAAQTVSLYDIQHITPEARRLAELVLSCTLKIQEVLTLLSNMKNARRMTELCNEIGRLESDADHVMHAALSRLFREEPDVRNLIKLKTLYEFLETVTDHCEAVANIVEGIVVQNA